MSGGRAPLLAVLAGVALVAAGCGGSAKAPPVASLGTTTPSSGRSDSASNRFGSLPPGGLVAGGSTSTQVGTGAAGVKFATCMRSHGVPHYPDPDDQGVITIDSSLGIDPSSPRYQQAAGDCQKLLPPGKTLSPAQQQRVKANALAFAACMRSHGVPHYPDPTFGSGGMVSQKLSRGDGDPSSPLFRAAQKACLGKHAGGG